MNKAIFCGLLLAITSTGIALADPASHDYSTNIFAGGEVGWYANTMTRSSMLNGQQGHSDNSNSQNQGYNDESSHNLENNEDNYNAADPNCECEEDY